MQGVKTVGLDIAKSVFQVHGIDTGEQVIIRRKLKTRDDGSQANTTRCRSCRSSGCQKQVAHIGERI